MNLLRTIRLLNSNLGMDGGWVIESEGTKLGTLSNCRLDDMFWYFYDLDTERPELRKEDFWDDMPPLIFRSAAISFSVTNRSAAAHAAGPPASPTST